MVRWNHIFQDTVLLEENGAQHLTASRRLAERIVMAGYRVRCVHCSGQFESASQSCFGRVGAEGSRRQRLGTEDDKEADLLCSSLRIPKKLRFAQSFVQEGIPNTLPPKIRTIQFLWLPARFASLPPSVLPWRPVLRPRASRRWSASRTSRRRPPNSARSGAPAARRPRFG